MATLSKANRNNVNNLMLIFMLIATLFMSIGYASINSITMNINGSVIAKSQDGVFITDVKLLSGTGEVISYFGTTLGSNTTLLDNSSDEVIYEITIYNSTEEDIPYFGEIYDKEDNSLFYTNPNIGYEVSIQKGTNLASKDGITFTITFKYKDNKISENKNLESYIQFVFVEDVYLFDYTGEQQEFNVPINGIYKLEVWGASGGNTVLTYIGGYGGYSTGVITFSKNEKVYLTIGGKGSDSPGTGDNNIHISVSGGYNGGGDGSQANVDCSVGGGGGATSITKGDEYRGELYEYDNYRSEVLIVAGGGSGGYQCQSISAGHYGTGSSGGGFEGGYNRLSNNMNAGTQTTGFAFGTAGCTAPFFTTNFAGGGGGYFGGSCYWDGQVGAGSGYIGDLSEKIMYCYNCPTSDNETTKTISTTNFSDTPISNHSKIGNGYAKITLISID